MRGNPHPEISKKKLFIYQENMLFLFMVFDSLKQ
jgi:hypothetical protein